VKVITCGFQANGSAYFLTIALTDVTRQDVNYCSAREFNATIQFNQVSLLGHSLESEVVSVKYEEFYRSLWYKRVGLSLSLFPARYGNSAKTLLRGLAVTKLRVERMVCNMIMMC